MLVTDGTKRARTKEVRAVVCGLGQVLAAKSNRPDRTPNASNNLVGVLTVLRCRWFRSEAISVMCIPTNEGFY